MNVTQFFLLPNTFMGSSPAAYANKINAPILDPEPGPQRVPTGQAPQNPVRSHREQASVLPQFPGDASRPKSCSNPTTMSP